MSLTRRRSGLLISAIALLIPLLSAVPASAEATGVIATTPAPLLDTATGIGAGRGPVFAHTTVLVSSAGRAGLPRTGAGAVELTVTAGEPTADGTLTVSAAGLPGPLPPTLTFTRGSTASRTILLPLLPGGLIFFINGSSGSLRLRAVVTGYLPAGSVPGRPGNVHGFGQKVEQGGLSITFTMPAGPGSQASYTLHDRTDPSRPDLVVTRPVDAAAGSTVTQLIGPADGVKPHLYSVSIAITDGTVTGLPSAPVALTGSPCGSVDYGSLGFTGTAKGPLVTFTLPIDPQGGEHTTVIVKHRGRTDTLTFAGTRPVVLGPFVDDIGYNPYGTNIDYIVLSVRNECGSASGPIFFPSFERPHLAITATGGNHFRLAADNLLPNSWIPINCHTAESYIYDQHLSSGSAVSSTFYVHTDGNGAATASPPRTCTLTPTGTDQVGWVALGSSQLYDANYYSNAIPLT